MEVLTEKDIYFHSLIKRRINLRPQFLDEHLNTNIENILKNEVEGKCIKEGYIVPSTIEIKKRSIGNLCSNQFTGNVIYDITYSAKICNIPLNSVIRAKVMKMNENGIKAVLGPLMIYIQKELHQNKDVFKTITYGDEIDILVINKSFDLGSKDITVMGKLNSESKKKIVLKTRKIKHKNDDKLAEAVILEENENRLKKESEEGLEETEDLGSQDMIDSDEEGLEDMEAFEEELTEEDLPDELDQEIIDDEEGEEY